MLIGNRREVRIDRVANFDDFWTMIHELENDGVCIFILSKKKETPYCIFLVLYLVVGTSSITLYQSITLYRKSVVIT